jgi:hypothetical protein
VTSSVPALGEQEMIGSTESTGVNEGGFTSADSDSNTESA